MAAAEDGGTRHPLPAVPFGVRILPRRRVDGGVEGSLTPVRQRGAACVDVLRVPEARTVAVPAQFETGEPHSCAEYDGVVLAETAVRAGGDVRPGTPDSEHGDVDPVVLPDHVRRDDPLTRPVGLEPHAYPGCPLDDMRRRQHAVRRDQVARASSAAAATGRRYQALGHPIHPQHPLTP